MNRLKDFVDTTQDFALSGKISLSKALLNSLSEHKNGFQIYTDYIKEFEMTHSNYNISALKRFPTAQQVKIHESDYKLSQPELEPNLFSFYSHSDVNRLARLLPTIDAKVYQPDVDHFIVIYWCDRLTNTSMLEYFHDFRCLSPDAPIQSNANVLFYLVTSEHNLYKIKNCANEFGLSPLDSFWMPNSTEKKSPYFASSDSSPITTVRHLGGLIFDILFTSGVTLLNTNVFQSIKTIDDLLNNETELRETIGAHLKLLLITTFCRLQVSDGSTKNLRLKRLTAKNRKSRTAALSPSNTYFSTLCCIGGSDKKTANQLSKMSEEQLNKDVIIICLYAGGQMATTLNAAYSRQVLNTIIKPVNTEKNKVLHLDDVTLFKKLNKQHQHQQQQEQNQSDEDDEDEDEDEDNETISYEFKKLCSCDSCANSTTYDINMSTYGPEQLITTSYTARDLLKILGQDSDENIRILDQLLDMSIAAMDIESMTVPLSADKPTSCAFNYQTIEKDVSVEDHSLYVQKPIMICHMDYLSRDYRTTSNSDPSTTKHIFFQSTNDDEASIYSFMKQYWLAVEERHQILCQQKYELSKPLWEIVHAYKNAHYKFHATWCEKYPRCCTIESNNHDFHHQKNYDSCSSTSDSDMDDNNSNEDMTTSCDNLMFDIKYRENIVEKSWKRSLAGQLAAELKRLISDYCIFSFYGSGYDHVLLEGYLLPFLYQQKQKPRMEKKGNKVLTIRTKSGVFFRDITKLLAPATNLASFGKLFNLEQVKAHFPFSYLDSVQKLLEPHLPTEIHFWTGELKVFSGHLSEAEKTGQIQKIIAEAQQLFSLTKCQNVGDYLRYYLRLDVEILYQASQLWRQHLKDLIQIDFLEHRKFTISSLSFLANQRNMSSHRKIGTFSVNNSQVYRLLRQGMRG